MQSNCGGARCAAHRAQNLAAGRGAVQLVRARRQPPTCCQALGTAGPSSSGSEGAAVAAAAAAAAPPPPAAAATASTAGQPQKQRMVVHFTSDNVTTEAASGDVIMEVGRRLDYITQAVHMPRLRCADTGIVLGNGVPVWPARCWRQQRAMWPSSRLPWRCVWAPSFLKPPGRRRLRRHHPWRLLQRQLRDLRGEHAPQTAPPLADCCAADCGERAAALG